MEIGTHIRVLREDGGLELPSWTASLLGDASPESLEIDVPGCEGASLVVRRGAAGVLSTVSCPVMNAIRCREFEVGIEAMILAGLRSLGSTTPIRMWNFLPGIHDRMESESNAGVLDRYQSFNSSRHRAFAAFMGEASVVSGRIPTASCVGHAGRGVVMHMLASEGGGKPVENPRQVSAFAYSRRYGPTPPSFARATSIRHGRERWLLIGGTSSVRGEDSVHEHDVVAQCEETLVNLRAIVAHAAGGGRLGECETLRGVRHCRVYVRDPEHRAMLLDRLGPEILEADAVELVRADICRRELMIEIEAVVRLPARHAVEAGGVTESRP